MTDHDRGFDEELLHGGVANAGAVTRQGDHVLRPSNPHTATIHAFLNALAETGFDGAFKPVGVDPDGRERLVFREGVAVGLLDFDYAAPGRPLYDLAQFARMCVPVDDDTNARMLGWETHDVFARLRLVVDASGLPPDRSEFLDILAGGIQRGGQFVRRKVESGDPNFIKMWNELGGKERFDRRRRWFDANRDRFAETLA